MVLKSNIEEVLGESLNHNKIFISWYKNYDYNSNNNNYYNNNGLSYNLTFKLCVEEQFQACRLDKI
jgi:hypothetical protein